MSAVNKLLIGDWHCHLRRSGFFGRYNHLSSTKQALEENYIAVAKRQGFDFLGVTFTVDNEPWYREMVMELAQKYDGQDGFLLLPNEEIQADWGHILYMGENFLLGIEGISLQEVCAFKDGDGGVIIAAHPQGYWNRDVFLSADARGCFDSLEFGPWGGYDMRFMVDYCRDKLERGEKTGYSGSSDIHCQPAMLNALGRTFLIAEELSKSAIIEAIKQRRTMGSFFEYLIGEPELCRVNRLVIEEQFSLCLRILERDILW